MPCRPSARGSPRSHAKLTAEQARQAIAPVLAAMQGTTDPDALQALGQGLAALAAKLTAEQARQAIAPVLAAMQGTTDPYALQALGQGLAALPVKAHRRAGAAGDRAGPRRHGRGPPTRMPWGPSARGSPRSQPKLTAEQARQAIAPVLAAMQGTTDPYALEALGQGLAALPVELTAEQARQAIAPVLAAMQGTTDPYALRPSARGSPRSHQSSPPSRRGRRSRPSSPPCRGPPTRMPCRPSARGSPRSHRAHRRAGAAGHRAGPRRHAGDHRPGMPWRPSARGSPRSQPKLTAEQARQAIAPVLAAIQGTTDPYALEALGQGLAALAPKLTAEQAVQVSGRRDEDPLDGRRAERALLKALQEKLAGYPEPPGGLWDIVAQIEQRFGKAIDLTTPPKGPDASAGVSGVAVPPEAADHPMP